MKSTTPQLSRRHFLQTAGLVSLASSALGSPQKAISNRFHRGRARSLIFLVADGMSHGTLAATQHWCNLRENRDCHWMQLYRDGLASRGLMETCSQSSIVTDSAAAASSWGCGVRIPNRRINIDKNDRILTPLYSYGKAAGKRLGLVTTATITHATPAGFAANQMNRDHQDAIASQYLERGIDVILGGGSNHLSPDTREDGRDLTREFKALGYHWVNDRNGLIRAPRTNRLLGTFARGHLPYSIDRQHDTDLIRSTPSLEMMITAALERLADAPEGFLLQVEAGRVDHAAHDNDPGAILQEMLEFDRCIALARRFAETSPDTLVIVTTDHGTGGFSINAAGEEYIDSTAFFLRLGDAKTSLETLTQQHAQTALSGPRIARALGLPDQAELAAQISAALIDWDPSTKLGLKLRSILAPVLAVSWADTGHTAELAEFAAFGPGAQDFPPFFENWEVHHRLREILGI